MVSTCSTNLTFGDGFSIGKIYLTPSQMSPLLLESDIQTPEVWLRVDIHDRRASPIGVPEPLPRSGTALLGSQRRPGALPRGQRASETPVGRRVSAAGDGLWSCTIVRRTEFSCARRLSGV